jgi:outer membrane protein assembly factor BamB
LEQESHELEVSEDRDIEEYRAYETSSSWVNEHLSSSKWSGEESGGIIVVATVDGSIAGLDRQTGKVKWKQQGVSLVESDLPSSTSSEDESTSNHSKVLSPLVSTTTTTKSSRHDWRTAAVPSVDGRVFLTASGSSEMTASSTLKELVARAPFVDARGRFYVGTRQATAAALDKSTGEILRVVSGDASPEPLAMEGRQVIWVGRVDYSISLFDARSGVMDVKFSASEVMGVQDMVVDSSVENEDGTMNLAAAPRLMLPTGMGEMNGDDRDKQLSMLVATPSGNVALRNPITGAIEWVSNEIFDAPVVFALEASTGMSLGVDILPDAPKPSNSFEYLAPQLERQIEVISSSQESSDQTIVGALSSGQLFAMPLGKRLSKQRSAAQQQHVGLPHHSLPTSSVIGSMPIGSSKVPNLISGRRSKPVSTDPDHQHSTLAKKSCGPTSPNFPACLVGGIHRNNDFLSGDSSFLDGSGNQREIALSRYPYGYPNSDDSGSAAVMNKRSFFKLMESWLPPTMALIFVLSFEMGRRLKAKRTKEEDNSMPLQTMLENHSSAVRNVGVITVTDQVLGFGGHGTVVYRGTLDGRQVAVKRMLKAYHASADREISLLIESDGHPNVVRYFLKEVHGDFVYLALELCDMSLHDLIGTLRQHSSPLQQPALSVVTKTTLHQVACGVRHLHSLRIVHR